MNVLEMPYLQQSLKSSGKLVCEFGECGNIKTIEQWFGSVLQDVGSPFYLEI